MRRSEKAMDEKAAAGILDRGEFGVLSMAAPQGGAYGVPLNYVYENGHLYVHCALEGRKIQCIEYDARVSFCVVGRSRVIPQRFTSSYESVVVDGRAYFCEGQEKIRGLKALLHKYAPEDMEKGMEYAYKDAPKTAVLRIEVLNVSGKRSL